jgi:predicted nucleic acid-binding protein
MTIQRVYADTSVYGGVFDEEFSEASRAFFEQAKIGRFSVATSVLVRQEMGFSPIHVQEFFDRLMPTLEIIPMTEEAVRLQTDYINAGVVTEKSLTDALHVALATVAGCPIIVSWNFKHIVHFQKIPQYNAVNRLRGYDAIAIHSPQEVIEDEDENV